MKNKKYHNVWAILKSSWKTRITTMSKVWQKHNNYPSVRAVPKSNPFIYFRFYNFNATPWTKLFFLWYFTEWFHKITLAPLLFMEENIPSQGSEWSCKCRYQFYIFLLILDWISYFFIIFRLYGILCFVYYLDNVLDAFNIYNYNIYVLVLL